MAIRSADHWQITFREAARHLHVFRQPPRASRGCSAGSFNHRKWEETGWKPKGNWQCVFMHLFLNAILQNALTCGHYRERERLHNISKSPPKFSPGCFKHQKWSNIGIKQAKLGMNQPKMRIETPKHVWIYNDIFVICTLPTQVYVYLSIYRSIYLSIDLFYLSLFLSIYIYIYIYAHITQISSTFACSSTYMTHDRPTIDTCITII